jgi:hypothetical protein
VDFVSSGAMADEIKPLPPEFQEAFRDALSLVSAWRSGKLSTAVSEMCRRYEELAPAETLAALSRLVYALAQIAGGAIKILGEKAGISAEAFTEIVERVILKKRD